MTQKLIELQKMAERALMGIAEAGGQESGTMEIDNLHVDDAIAFFEQNGVDILAEIPKFRENFHKAQKMARKGWTVRKDMPVISKKNMNLFFKVTNDGWIDWKPPFYVNTEDPEKSTDPDNVFPQDLMHARKERRRRWLVRGKGALDGNPSDDVINVVQKKIPAKDLKPIQKQIYFSKSGGGTVNFGIQGTKNFLMSPANLFVASKENYIIDGHHRWLSTMMIDPSMAVNAAVVDMDLDTLLDFTLAFGDAVDNERNK